MTQEQNHSSATREITVVDCGEISLTSTHPYNPFLSNKTGNVTIVVGQVSSGKTTTMQQFNNGYTTK